MQNMNVDRVGDELAKAYEEGYQKGIEDGYQKALKEQVPMENETCDDEGNCVSSTVLESFKEDVWEE